MTITVNGSGIVFSDGSTMYTDMPVLYSSGSLSGTSTTISGIPSDARIVWLLLNGYQTSSTGLARISVSGGSGYYSSYTNTSTTAVVSTVSTAAAYWTLTTTGASTYVWQYKIKFIKMSIGWLIMSGSGGSSSTGRQMWTGGTCTCSSFTSITIDNSAGNTQVGNWSVSYA